MALIFLLFCGETAYGELYNRTLQDFNCAVFEKGYDKTEMAKDLQEISEKYDLCALYPIYEYADSDIDIFCCTNGSTENVKKKLSLDSCDFNTILSGSHSIRIIDESETDKYVTGDYIISAFYFCGDEALAYEVCDELYEKYELSLDLCCGYSSRSSVVWVICAVLVILMSIYDMLDSKKEVCIRLTLGNSLPKQLAGILLCDTAVFAISGILIALIMYRLTAVMMIAERYAMFIVSICLLNALVFMGLYLVDVCSSLKNENSSSVYLPINYMLKIISAIALMCVVCAANRLPVILSKHDSAEYFKEHYGTAARIDLSESPKWAVMIDSIGYTSEDEEDHRKVGLLMDKLFSDYDRFLSLLDADSGVFLMNGFEYYPTNYVFTPGSTQNILIASDEMSGYIAHQTGVTPASEGISVLLPKTYKMSDLRAVNEWLELEKEEYSFETFFLDYGSAELAAIEYYGEDGLFTDDMYLSVLSSPIIIYAPHAADYNFFDLRTVLANADRSDTERILNANAILSTRVDVSTVRSMAEDHKRKTVSVTILFVLAFAALFVYYLALLISTLAVDVNVNSRERAVRKILGRSFASRYLKLMLTFAGSLLISVLGALMIDNNDAVGPKIIILMTAAIMFVLEIISVMTAAKLDDKNNTLRELKGGAL